MELRLESRTIQDALAQASQLLKDRRLVVVFGDRLSLNVVRAGGTDSLVSGGRGHHGG